ncbi:putative protein WVD2-like/6 [Dioscorea sansibarensis]
MLAYARKIEIKIKAPRFISTSLCADLRSTRSFQGCLKSRRKVLNRFEMDVITVTSDSLNMMKLGSSEVVHAHEGNGSLDHSVQQDAQAHGGIEDGMENPSVPEIKIEALSRDQGGTKAPVTISKERRGNSLNRRDHAKSMNAYGGKSEKSSTTAPVILSQARKKGNGSQAEMATSVSGVSIMSTPHSKKPVVVNGRQAINGANRSTKPISSRSATHMSQSVIVGDTTSAVDVLSTDGSKEEMTNLKTLKQIDTDKVEDHPHLASLSPSAGSMKPQRFGTMPSYSFSFRCNERAEKRKEFYSKLEEKIRAKEEEKTSLQAKSKETQEAEIKQLRKSLTFKATPMPSFYQEPAPPKVELKKIPPTRAKSPKLGRQKSTASTDGKGIISSTCRSDRLSLDGGKHQKGLSKDTSLHAKKPQRMSLPKLPSEETPSSVVDCHSQTLEPKDEKLDPEIPPIDAENSGLDRIKTTDKDMKPADPESMDDKV